MTKITNNALLNFLMIRTQICILNLYKLWLVPVFGSFNTMQQAKLNFKPVAQTLPVGIYLLKVNNRNTRARCEICLNLIIKTPERRVVKIAAVGEIVKHSILDIELNEKNLFPCVLMGFTTKQNIIKEGRYCKMQKFQQEAKNFYFITLK